MSNISLDTVLVKLLHFLPKCIHALHLPHLKKTVSFFMNILSFCSFFFSGNRVGARMFFKFEAFLKMTSGLSGAMDEKDAVQYNLENDLNLEDVDEILPHAEITDIFQEGLAMLVQDPLLCDLPIQVTLEEINSQIALEFGQAMTVKICKASGEVMRKIFSEKFYFLFFYTSTCIKMLLCTIDYYSI
uniref:Uncharacterized protein n=1 Tax=Leptobrachium leishanense TaxID=445787 RepID=A0A8C5MWW7_9ANUR